jgi:hypothetical protein
VGAVQARPHELIPERTVGVGEEVVAKSQQQHVGVLTRARRDLNIETRAFPLTPQDLGTIMRSSAENQYFSGKCLSNVFGYAM